MILIDYSQLIIAGATAFGSDFDKGKDTKKMVDILRHTILSTLLADKRKYGREYGQIVLAVDGREYWRKGIFSYYKAHRKKNRDESKTDWKAIFDIGSQLRQEFEGLFPYRFVMVNEAEADDVIAVLTKYTQENELRTIGLIDDEPQPVFIKSNDGDFGQLHKYKNVRQWNPILKKFVKKTDKHFLLEKILTGDSGDGIPNIRSSDSQLVDGIRQPPITAKIKEAAFKQADDGLPIDFADTTMNRNYQRNRQLIDFDYIPQEIADKIIATYKGTEGVKADKSKIFNYFIKHRCKNLLDSIQEF